MNQSETIARLELEWEGSTGFFARLRDGDFDRKRALGILRVISELSLGDDAALQKRLVSLLWYLPLFLTWQEERVAEQSGDVQGYRLFVNQVTALLEEKLGVP
jgi:hypothetical protein